MPRDRSSSAIRLDGEVDMLFSEMNFFVSIRVLWIDGSE